MSTFLVVQILLVLALFAWWYLRRKLPEDETGADLVAPSRKTVRPDTKSASHHWSGAGDYEFEVVGESFYQRSLAAIAGQYGAESAEVECTATLVPEDSNPHDPKAVAVFIQGHKVAHLSREDARSFRRRLGQKKLAGESTTCDALVVGGGVRRNGEKLMYGVKLDIKPFE